MTGCRLSCFITWITYHFYRIDYLQKLLKTTIYTNLWINLNMRSQSSQRSHIDFLVWILRGWGCYGRLTLLSRCCGGGGWAVADSSCQETKIDNRNLKIYHTIRASRILFIIIVIFFEARLIFTHVVCLSLVMITDEEWVSNVLGPLRVLMLWFPGNKSHKSKSRNNAVMQKLWSI